jgi:hypothetical protein
MPLVLRWKVGLQPGNDLFRNFLKIIQTVPLGRESAAFYL